MFLGTLVHSSFIISSKATQQPRWRLPILRHPPPIITFPRVQPGHNSAPCLWKSYRSEEDLSLWWPFFFNSMQGRIGRANILRFPTYIIHIACGLGLSLMQYKHYINYVVEYDALVNPSIINPIIGRPYML